MKDEKGQATELSHNHCIHHHYHETCSSSSPPTFLSTHFSSPASTTTPPSSSTLWKSPLSSKLISHMKLYLENATMISTESTVNVEDLMKDKKKKESVKKTMYSIVVVNANEQSTFYYGVDVKRFMDGLIEICGEMMANEQVDRILTCLTEILSHFYRRERILRQYHVKQMTANVNNHEQRILANAQYIACYQTHILLFLTCESLRTMLSNNDPLSPAKRRMLCQMFLRIAPYYTSQSNPQLEDSLCAMVSRILLHSQFEFMPFTILYVYLKMKLPVPQSISDLHREYLMEKVKKELTARIGKGSVDRFEASQITSRDDSQCEKTIPSPNKRSLEWRVAADESSTKSGSQGKSKRRKKRK